MVMNVAKNPFGKSSSGAAVDENAAAMYNHMMSDVMGRCVNSASWQNHLKNHRSVAVIVSTLLEDKYGMKRADPICSLILSVLILKSVLPLLQSTAECLLLRSPRHMQKVSSCI